jgi:hypothetical protein
VFLSARVRFANDNLEPFSGRSDDYDDLNCPSLKPQAPKPDEFTDSDASRAAEASCVIVSVNSDTRRSDPK